MAFHLYWISVSEQHPGGNGLLPFRVVLHGTTGTHGLVTHKLYYNEDGTASFSVEWDGSTVSGWIPAGTLLMMKTTRKPVDVATTSAPSGPAERPPIQIVP